MLLFWSEEHIARWCRSWTQPRGAVLALETAWRLAAAWYSADRREPTWRRKTVEEAAPLFAELGLTSPFWQLPR
jgi:hypothetical protein